MVTRLLTRPARSHFVKCVFFFITVNLIIWLALSGNWLPTAPKSMGSGVREKPEFHINHISYHGDVLPNNKSTWPGSALKGARRVESKDGRDKAETYNLSAQSDINPHPYGLLINEPTKCFDVDNGQIKSVFLLVLIVTVHRNARLRRAVRETWGSVTEVDGSNIVTVFLLGQTDNLLHRRAILTESARFHDLLLEDFADSYENLTLKTVMGLKWVAEYCAHAKYVMKTDDDMFVSYENIVRYLKLPKTSSSRFVVGRKIHEAPIRDPRNKWYVPPSVYKGKLFPPFCSGTGYVLSSDIAPLIVLTSFTIPYLSLEDVFVGLCLERLHIRPRWHIEFNNGNVKYSYCRYKTIFTSHLRSEVSFEGRYNIWKDLQKPESPNCNIPFWPGNDPIFG